MSTTPPPSPPFPLYSILIKGCVVALFWCEISIAFIYYMAYIKSHIDYNIEILDVLYIDFMALIKSGQGIHNFDILYTNK